MSKTCIVMGQLLGLILVAPALAQTTHDITVGPGGAFIFSPNAVVIDVGDTVRWTWDSDGHNVGYGVPGFADNSVFFSGPPALSGTVFQVVFDQAFINSNPVPDNVYDYHCHPHGAAFGMVGSVTIARPVPAASAWGTVAITLLLLATASVIIGRRRSALRMES